MHIYSHPQTDSFVVSQLFSVARHVRRSKPRSKPTEFYVKEYPLSHACDSMSAWECI